MFKIKSGVVVGSECACVCLGHITAEEGERDSAELRWKRRRFPLKVKEEETNAEAEVCQRSDMYTAQKATWVSTCRCIALFRGCRQCSPKSCP